MKCEFMQAVDRHLSESHAHDLPLRPTLLDPIPSTPAQLAQCIDSLLIGTPSMAPELAIAFDELRSKNVEALKLLNSIVLPVRTPVRRLKTE